MARRAAFPDGVVEGAESLVARASTVWQLKAGLSVVLSARFGLSNADVAAALGVGTATVVRLHNEMRSSVSGAGSRRSAWGGRRHQTLSVAEEKAFLTPWEETAAHGGVLVVPPVRAALEARVGHPVAASTVYRLLSRHGWRRVEPDSAHPKRDEKAQEAFKKGASRKVWQKR
jgi:transposase